MKNTLQQPKKESGKAFAVTLKEALEEASVWKNSSFLTLKDHSPQAIKALLNLAQVLKEKKKHYPGAAPLLPGKHIVLLFEKTSTRTRCAFEVAVRDEGGHATFLSTKESQIGKKESIEDSAKVLGRYYDGIEFRGFQHATVESLAKHAGVPVWNGLTDLYHPTQVLADFLTISEKLKKPLNEVTFAYVGDARNNMANSLMIGGATMGMDFRAVAPASLFPGEDLVRDMKQVAAVNGGSISLVESPEEGVAGADVVYTDVWVSMGEEDQFADRIRQLLPYQVNTALMKATGKKDSLFMHCLPALHDLGTQMGQGVYDTFGLKELEVTDEVFRSPQSVVFDEAENRLHTIKALMVATLA